MCKSHFYLKESILHVGQKVWHEVTRATSADRMNKYACIDVKSYSEKRSKKHAASLEVAITWLRICTGKLDWWICLLFYWEIWWGTNWFCFKTVFILLLQLQFAFHFSLRFVDYKALVVHCLRVAKVGSNACWVNEISQRLHKAKEWASPASFTLDRLIRMCFTVLASSYFNCKVKNDSFQYLH